MDSKRTATKLETFLVDSDGMEGTYQRNGTWGFRANVPNSKGRQVRRGGFPTEAAAFRARIDFLHGAYTSIKPSEMTMREWFYRWLLIVKETCKESTYNNYKDVVETWLIPLFGDVLLVAMEEETIRRGYRQMVEAGYMTNTIKGTHRRLRSSLEVAMVERYITINSAKNVRPPKGKPPKKRTIWDTKEATKFANYIMSQRDAAMWLTFISTGARRGEINKLDWAEVDLDREEIYILDAKTDAGRRVIPITTRLGSVLRGWRSNQLQQRLLLGPNWPGGEAVFTTSRGNRYHLNSPRDRLIHICEEAGVKFITPHNIRHTFGTLALRNNMNVKILSEIMGHASTTTTQDLYQQVPDDVAKEAVESLVSLFG